MWLLQLLAWIGSELLIARAAADSIAEPLSILHAGENSERQPKELEIADGRWPTADSR